jgi:hypothetical protein
MKYLGPIETAKLPTLTSIGAEQDYGGSIPWASRSARLLEYREPDCCAGAAARRVDEAASGRAPGGVALRDRQTG